MIKLDLTRQKAMVQSTAMSKTQKAIKNHLLNRIKSSPYNETQHLSITIKDHPFERFFTRFFDITEEVVNADLKADFTRAYMENGQLKAKKYQFSDTFKANQLTELKEGNHHSFDKNSFIYKLAEKINKAIEE